MSLFTDLVSAWTFEDGSNLGKDSFGSNHLTNNNGVTQVTGKVGHAASFNGSNQSLSIPSNASLVLHGTSWELTTWMRAQSPLPTTGNYPAIISKWGGGSLEYLLLLNGDFSARIEGVATADGSTQKSVNNGGIGATNFWYFLDLWFDFPNTTLNLYVGNAPAVVVPSVALTDTFAGTSSFCMATTAFGAPFWKGELDGANLWKRNLSSGERSQLWNSGNGLEYPFSSGQRRRASSYIIR